MGIKNDLSNFINRKIYSKEEIEKNKQELLKLRAKIEKNKVQLKKLKETIAVSRNEFDNINQSISADKELSQILDLQKKAHENLTNLLDKIKSENNVQESGLFIPRYNFASSLNYKDKLARIRENEKLMIDTGDAVMIKERVSLNGDYDKGEALQNSQAKALTRCFNGEADAIIYKVTASNWEQRNKQLGRIFVSLNRIFKKQYMSISEAYLRLKQDELKLAAEYELKKEEEREALREQREKEREDKKLQEEIKNARKQIEKDKHQYQNAILKTQERLQNAASTEIAKLKQQLEEYRQKMADLSAEEESVDYREGHATAGYVYVISNIGSFGEGIFKIGVTRRLDPYERIAELSSASVPFRFDVHTMIFSEDAYGLETELHQTFDKYKVNQVNLRKEYFKVPLKDIEDVLAKHKDLTVDVTENAEAFEFHQSLAIASQKLNTKVHTAATLIH